MSEIAVEYRRDRECVNTHRPLTHSLDYGKEQAVKQHTCETSGCGQTIKTCTKCGESKPLTEYHRQSKYSSGHASACKVCNNTRQPRPHSCETDGCDHFVKDCSGCGESKLLVEYHRQARDKDGHGPQCKVCSRSKKKAYYEENIDRLAARNKAWYEANKDSLVAWQKSYYEVNRDKILARNKNRHAEKWDADPEYRARFHAAEIRRKRLLANAKSEPYLRESIFERDGWKCGLCGEQINPELRHPDPGFASIDHILPLSLGGDDTPANVQSAHLRCNLSKNNRVDLNKAA